MKKSLEYTLVYNGEHIDRGRQLKSIDRGRQLKNIDRGNYFKSIGRGGQFPRDFSLNYMIRW